MSRISAGSERKEGGVGGRLGEDIMLAAGCNIEMIGRVVLLTIYL
jgi:hypothetical protein